MLGHLIEVTGGEDSRLDALDFLDFGEEHGPDAALGFEGELAVFEAEVDAGLEGRVEVFDAVGGEEEDALEVFEQAQEDADEGVAVDVLGLYVMLGYEFVSRIVGVSLPFASLGRHLPRQAGARHSWYWSVARYS